MSQQFMEAFLPDFKKKTGEFTIYAKALTLQLKHVFTLSGSSRSTTPAVLVALEHQGVRGYGEASMPFYLGESSESVLRFLSKVDLSSYNDPFYLEDILTDLDASSPGDSAAKAAVDIALHDLTGKLSGLPCYKLFGLNPARGPRTSFTIGIDEPARIEQKVIEAKAYPLLKVKLGGADDRGTIEVIRKITSKPLCVDVNQGWKDRQQALDMAFWLKEQNVLFIEQPMDKNNIEDNAWLTQRSPLPTIADEAVQRLADIPAVLGAYSGINIKLMKCTGMREAYKMIQVAKAAGLKVMLGCMTETSCAISAAAQLSPLADWADLDGNLLIENDAFRGVTVQDGWLRLKERPGIGVEEI